MGSPQGKVLQDTILEKQLIYNGRIWRNLHIRVRGHPYFLASGFNSGNVIFNGKEFRNLKIIYDIHDDEIILYVNPQTIIMLNKEMVERLTFNYENRMYTIHNFGNDTTSLLRGYVNVLYDGPTALYTKYIKKIESMAEENKYDRFYQVHRMYIMKDNQIVQVSGKKELLKLLEPGRKEIKDYIKKNKLTVIRKDPYSFIPILMFYDSLKR